MGVGVEDAEPKESQHDYEANHHKESGSKKKKKNNIRILKYLWRKAIGRK